MGTGVEELGTMNLYITPPNFTLILLITFDCQYFLT